MLKQKHLKKIHDYLRPHGKKITAGSIVVLFLFVAAQAAIYMGASEMQGSVIQTDNEAVERVARRLQRRLSERKMPAPPFSKIKGAVRTRQSLLKRKAIVVFSNEDGEERVWDISTQRYPLWIRPEFSNKVGKFYLDEQIIQKEMEVVLSGALISPTDVTLLSYTDEGDVLRVETDGIAKYGDVLHLENTVQDIVNDMREEKTEIMVPIEREAGKIHNKTKEDLGELELLATGRSNFRGSTWARMQNVRKALNQHVNNVLVAPDELFSFNGTLGGPVTTRNGWYMAKIIVNGADLELAPGGGICQASTTTYRAILNAGFVLKDRKAHSLYVSYYEKYGVGIDATIYPGSQDLTFINDTDKHILIQSYTDGYEAFVNIYGTDDGREVEIEGPYFTDTVPRNIGLDRSLSSNEIAWVHNIRYPDGTKKKEVILSRYRVLPRYIVKKYTNLMHASAE